MKKYSYFLPKAKVTSIVQSVDPNDIDVTLYIVVINSDNGPF